MRSLVILLALAGPTMGYIFVHFWNHCESPVNVFSVNSDNKVHKEETVATGAHYIKLRYEDPVSYTFGKDQKTKIDLVFNPFWTAFSLDIRNGLEFSIKLQPTYFQSPNGTAIFCPSIDGCPDAIHNDKEEKSNEKVVHTKATALVVHMCYKSKSVDYKEYDYPENDTDYPTEKRTRQNTKDYPDSDYLSAEKRTLQSDKDYPQKDYDYRATEKPNRQMDYDYGTGKKRSRHTKNRNDDYYYD